MVCGAKEGNVTLREHMFGGEGTAEVRALFEKGAYHGHCRLMAELTLKPGESVGQHTHEGDEELIYMLEGTCRYEDNGRWTELHTGDAALTRSGESHEICNDSDNTVRYLAVVLTDA